MPNKFPLQIAEMLLGGFLKSQQDMSAKQAELDKEERQFNRTNALADLAFKRQFMIKQAELQFEQGLEQRRSEALGRVIQPKVAELESVKERTPEQERQLKTFKFILDSISYRVKEPLKTAIDIGNLTEEKDVTEGAPTAEKLYEASYQEALKEGKVKPGAINKEKYIRDLRTAGTVEKRMGALTAEEEVVKKRLEPIIGTITQTGMLDPRKFSFRGNERSTAASMLADNNIDWEKAVNNFNFVNDPVLRRNKAWVVAAKPRIESLRQRMLELGNTQFPTVNAVKNFLLKELGNKEIVALISTRDSALFEALRGLGSGAQASDLRIKIERALLDENYNPQQFEASINNVIDALKAFETAVKTKPWPNIKIDQTRPYYAAPRFNVDETTENIESGSPLLKGQDAINAIDEILKGKK